MYVIYWKMNKIQETFTKQYSEITSWWKRQTNQYVFGNDISKWKMFDRIEVSITEIKF